MYRQEDEIAQLIQKAIKKGEYTIEIDKNIDPFTKHKLLELGYEVITRRHMRAEFFYPHYTTMISWVKE